MDKYVKSTKKTHRELLCYYLVNRKDIKLSFALYLIFRIFGYNIKKLFLKLTDSLYKKKCYKERIKFLTTCRFYRVVPNHLEFITKNIKQNCMFSKKW